MGLSVYSTFHNVEVNMSRDGQITSLQVIHMWCTCMDVAMLNCEVLQRKHGINKLSFPTFHEGVEEKFVYFLVGGCACRRECLTKKKGA
jgi:hypothetical protein